MKRRRQDPNEARSQAFKCAGLWGEDLETFEQRMSSQTAAASSQPQAPSSLSDARPLPSMDAMVSKEKPPHGVSGVTVSIAA